MQELHKQGYNSGWFIVAGATMNHMQQGDDDGASGFSFVLPLMSLHGRAVQLMRCWSRHMQIKQGFSSGTQLCIYCTNK